MRLFILYTLLQLYFFVAVSQPVYFRHHQVEDGLANNTVFSVFQDTRGFMWFGTKEGLNRFDGVNFKAFDIKLNNGTNVKEFVYCIREGIQQTLWIGTRKGLYEFDPGSEKFSLIGPTAHSEILDIVPDGNGNIWFTSDLQLYCYNERRHSMHRYDLRLVQALKVASICVDKDGEIWAASLEGFIFRYDAAKDCFYCVNGSSDSNHQRPAEVTKIYTTASGQILIGSVRGLTSYDPVMKMYRNVLGQSTVSKPVFVRDIILFSPGVYWIASESGIFKIDLETGQYINMRQEDSNPYSISDNAVYTLFKDREGGIWCGTYFGGVNYYHKQHSYFSKYLRTNRNRLSGNAIRELCADKRGGLWIGTEDAGLNKLNISTGNISHFSAPASVSSTNIHALLVDGNKLWVGTFQQGLDILDMRTGKRLKHYNANSEVNGLGSNFIISSLKTSTGELLFGTSHGIYSYKQRMERFAKATGFPENIYVFSIFEGLDGTIWAGTIGNGLYFYNPRTKKKGNFRYNGFNNNSLSSNSVCGIFEDSYQNLWISTEGGGLCKLSNDRCNFTRFNIESGLPSNMVYKVLEDKSKRLWISTSRGLVLYNPAKNSWRIFTKANGLLTDQFNYSSGYRDSTGTMYFGSVKGLISFNPDTAVFNTTGLPVYVTSFQVNNQDLKISSSAMPRSVSFTNSIRLQYYQSSITIGFAALTYIAPEITKYAYKMEGLDQNWTYIPANRKIYFTDLSPGSYIFKIKAANADGSWSDKETKLLINISPPWWLSTLAYIIYVIIFLIFIFVLIRSYHRRQKQKHKRKMERFEQEKEKEIYKSKIEFFTNVAHEIRTPLTLIKAPLEIAIDEAEDKPGIKKNLKKIEKNTERLVALTNQLLDFRKTENQDFSLSFVKVKIASLVTDIYNNFEPAAQKKSLYYHIQLPERDFYAFVDIEAFEKILNNLIGNAVKYAEKTVMIRVVPPSAANNRFNMEIANDGIPIPWALRDKIFEPFFRINANEQPGSGIGLSLARSLAQLHNGFLELQNTNSNGMNLFILTLPVHQKIEFNLGSVKKKFS